MNPQNLKSNILFGSLLFYIACTFFSMALMSIGAGVLFLAVLGYHFDSQNIKKVKELFSSPAIRTYLALTFLLFLALFFSLLVARNSPVTLNNFVVEVSFLKDLSKIWYLFWPIVLCLCFLQLKNQYIEILQKFWIFLLCLFGTLAINQYFTGWPREQMIIYFEPFRYQASLFIGHHLSVASIFIFPFFFSLDYLFLKKRPLKEFLIYLLPCVFGLILLFLTFSRMLWIGLPIGILIWLVLRLKLKQILIITALVFSLTLGALQNEKVQQNIAHRGGISERIELWRANLEFYKMRPLIGVGFRKNGDLSGPYLKDKLKTEHVFAGHAHNNFLEMLASTGIIGASIWLIWCLLPLGFLLWLKVHGHPLSQGFMVAWVVFHISGLTQVNFWDGKVLHQVALMLGWTLFFTFNTKANTKKIHS